jgi:hypothetical protein
LPLPSEGRPKDFSGAVGSFKIASDISTTRAAVGDPLTLRLHVSGAGNFDRVDSPMLDHLEHWKTYPAKSAFTPSDAVGYKGEKVFEQPLIASQPGDQSIPEIAFSYFDPEARRYERARTAPIKVAVATSLSDRSLGAPADAGSRSGSVADKFSKALRPDHPPPRTFVSSLTPLYFQARFLAAPAALVLIFAASWFGVHTGRRRSNSKAADRALARLDAAARSGDSSSFFDAAQVVLAQTFAARWQMLPDQITPAELHARLGSEGEGIARLFALADEARYFGHIAGSVDYSRWMTIVRRELAWERT